LGFARESDRQNDTESGRIVTWRWNPIHEPVVVSIADRRLDQVAKQQRRPVSAKQRQAAYAAARDLVWLCDPACPVKTVWRGKDPKLIAGDLLANDRWHLTRHRWRIAPGALAPSKRLWTIHTNATRARFARAGELHREDDDNRSADYAMRRVTYWDPVRWESVERVSHRPIRAVISAADHAARLEAAVARDGIIAFAPDLYGRLQRDLAIVIRHRDTSRSLPARVGDEVKVLLGVPGVRLTTDVLAALRTVHRTPLAAWIAKHEVWMLDVGRLDREEAA
jgi:hypothetical protein